MKRIILLLFALLPMLIKAQDGCDFFEYRKIEVEKTGLNTSQSDFGPAFVSEELWYSAFTDSKIEKLSKGDEKDIFYNLFSEKVDREGNVTGSKNVQFEEISAGYHAGPVSYCEKTKELFVTLSNFDNPEIKNRVYQKADIRLKIITARKTDGVWKVVEEFPYNDPAYSVGHPAISITGDTLFFASNKPNSGFGETDIYMSVKTNGSWGNPINLGDQINTKYDEMFPFFFKGSMLFYASNKGETMKEDHNIFYSCIDGNTFTKPQLLDELNTDEDDFGLIVHPNGEVGYFASRRTGGLGDDDIYKVIITGEFYLELIVMDRKTMQPISKPKVKFSDNVPLVLSGNIIKRALDSNSSILATSEIEGYQNSSVNITTVGKAFGTIRDTIWIEKVEVGQKFVMENIFYDFDKWDILPESEIELNKLIKIMNENPSWKVELGSHTDSRGTDSYNKVLSQKRSGSAVGYIIKNGIDKGRIIAKGYGEYQLVNHCGNGVECSDDEHRKNRRTEFKILEMDAK